MMKTFSLPYKYIGLGIWIALIGIIIALFIGDVHYSGLSGTYYRDLQWQTPWKENMQDREISHQGKHLQEAGQQLRNRFSVTWSGYIAIKEPGMYTFSTNSDDGSWLFINNTLIVDNGGVHGLQYRSGQIYLEKGLHTIQIQYTQTGGFAALRVYWAQGNAAGTILPTHVLFVSSTPAIYRWLKPYHHILILLWAFWGLVLLLVRLQKQMTWQVCIRKLRDVPKKKLMLIEHALLIAAPVILLIGLHEYIPRWLFLSFFGGALLLFGRFHWGRGKRLKGWHILLCYLGLIAVLSYLVAMWQIYHIQNLRVFGDTDNYTIPAGVSLSNIVPLFTESRLFVTSFLFTAFDYDWAQLNGVFIIAYLCASLLFIWVATLYFQSLNEKLLCAYLLLFLFCNQQFMSLWLSVALSETPSIVTTLTLFSLFGITYYYKRLVNRKLEVSVLIIGGTTLAAFLFTFTRDANLYFLPVFALFYLAIFRKWSRRFLCIGMILLVFFLHKASTDHSERWQFPLKNIVMSRVLPNTELRHFFQQRHELPSDDIVMDCAGRWGDCDNKEVILAWIDTQGLKAYKHFLISHPSYVLRAWIDNWKWIYNVDQYYLWNTYVHKDVSKKQLDFFMFDFPGEVSSLTALAIFLFGIIVFHRNPLVLILLSHAFVIGLISYHGDEMELARHCQQAAMTLKIAFLIFIAYGYARIKTLEDLENKTKSLSSNRGSTIS